MAKEDMECIRCMKTSDWFMLLALILFAVGWAMAMFKLGIWSCPCSVGACA